MKKFTEIGQFRQAIREIKSRCDYQGKDDNGDAIYAHNKPYPVLKFKGSVKLHGTNSAIALYKDSEGNLEYKFQSRERELSLESDNYGFMREMQGKDYKKLFEGIDFNDSCVIYGEWCGGNIQNGVAIAGLPKMFVVFAVRIDDVYQEFDKYKYLMIPEQGIYNIMQFKTYEIDVDINQPELVQNRIIEMTIEVEDECPVGKHFGVSGIGEGIVFVAHFDGERYVYKSKGMKHSSSHVKTISAVDVEAIQNINEFVEYAVTENRLSQGIDKMVELGIALDAKSTGDYLRWVYNDVIKEESDTIIQNGIDPKKIGSAISTKARQYWLNYLNSREL